MADPIPFKSKDARRQAQLDAWVAAQCEGVENDGALWGFHPDDVKFTMLQTILAGMSPLALVPVLAMIMEVSQFDPVELSFVRDALEEIIDHEPEIYGEAMKRFLSPTA